MTIIVDLIIVGILGLFLIIGYFKGLTGSLIKILSFVLAIIIAFVLFKPVSNFIINNTNLDENLELSIRNIIINQNNQEQIDEEEYNSAKDVPEVISEYINKAVEDASNNLKTTVADTVATNVAITIINAGTWIGLFLISRILLTLLKFVTKLITKLPIIKQFDKIGGILYGIIEGLLIIYIAFAIISFISPIINGGGIITSINKSYIGNIMYNNNLLLKIIFYNFT